MHVQSLYHTQALKDCVQVELPKTTAHTDGKGVTKSTFKVRAVFTPISPTDFNGHCAPSVALFELLGTVSITKNKALCELAEKLVGEDFSQFRAELHEVFVQSFVKLYNEAGRRGAQTGKMANFLQKVNMYRF